MIQKPLAGRTDEDVPMLKNLREVFLLYNRAVSFSSLPPSPFPSLSDHLSDLFHRPVTLVQNSTGSLFADLLECMLGKEWQRTTEAAVKAFPTVYDALKSPEKKRVVVICHSQGTIITSVILRMLSGITRKEKVVAKKKVPAKAPPIMAAEAFPAPAEFIYPRDEPIDLKEFEPLELEELAKLEIYAFANCANVMKYHQKPVDGGRPIPWIESFGNQYDLVARLGMLAPNPERWQIQIDGPRYERKGKWGHLLNEHYLVDIEKKQRVGYRRTPRGGTDPYCLPAAETEEENATPRLFQYINGGRPE